MSAGEQWLVMVNGWLLMDNNEVDTGFMMVDGWLMVGGCLVFS